MVARTGTSGKKRGCRLGSLVSAIKNAQGRTQSGCRERSAPSVRENEIYSVHVKQLSRKVAHQASLNIGLDPPAGVRADFPLLK
jgi:hypothetical protein